MVTLDGNLSNPLDQKLHTLLGHLQYISPITTILYISHSLHNLQYITQPSVHYTTNTTTYYIHHTHTTTFTYNNPLHTITGSCRHTCRSHALSCRLSCSHMYSLPLSCWFCWASLTWYRVWAIFPHFTPPFCWQAVHTHDLKTFFPLIFGCSIVFHGIFRPAQIPQSSINPSMLCSQASQNPSFHSHLVAKFPHLCLYKGPLLQLFPPSSPDFPIRFLHIV